jgi:hypothetical protein
MWDHTPRMCHYYNNDVHSRNKNMWLSSRLKRWKVKYRELRHELHDFQVSRLERMADIEQLHHNGHKYWADLTRLYVEEVQNCVIRIESTIDQYLHGRAGVK